MTRPEAPQRAQSSPCTPHANPAHIVSPVDVNAVNSDITQDSSMATLTSLPLSLQTRIFANLFDPELVHHRARLQYTNYYIPSRRPRTQISLDGVQTVNAPFPSELLAPALASPVLASATRSLLDGMVCFLTDVNTEACLPLWVRAYAEYVQAVSVSDLGEVWKNALPRLLRRRMVEKLCCDTVELFREITLNHVRLRVLDLVHAPFHKCDMMYDDMMSGLCATLEATQTSLKELALPIYLKSDLCARALETVTLPHLAVFSIELKTIRDYGKVSGKDNAALRAAFLRMMQAVEGHADRSRRLTSLPELRLINMHDIPCTNARDSGCSPGFFRAIETLRVSGDNAAGFDTFRDLRFLRLFTKMNVLFWTGVPTDTLKDFESLCKKLKEVHLCHYRWIKRVQLGADRHLDVVEFPFHMRSIWDGLKTSWKIRTLVTQSELLLNDLEGIWWGCPNLEYLSLYITQDNVYGLRQLAQKCKKLKGLEIVIDEEEFGRLGAEGWQEIGKAIPRRHDHLCEVAIQTRQRISTQAVPVDTAIKCFLTVVKRMGKRAEKLLFRAMVKLKTIARALNAIRSILDSCVKYSLNLSHFEIDVITRETPSEREDAEELRQAKLELQSGKELLIQSQPFLGKMEVELWRLSYGSYQRLPV